MMYRFDSRGAFLPKFLGGVFALFVAILIVCYYIARAANPIMLDEHGNPHYPTGAAVRPVKQ